MWFIVVALQLLGCGADEEAAPAVEVTAVEVAAALADSEASGALELAPMTFESLAPIFATTGAADQAPSSLVLSFARPVLEADKLTASLDITPAVEGSWHWVGAEFLEFRPTVGFQPETQYTAQVTSLTFDGEELGDASTIEPLRFKTPVFELLHASIVGSSYSNVQVSAIFSGAVGNQKADLENASVSALVDNSSDVRVASNARKGNQVFYQIYKRRIRDAKNLEISIPAIEGIGGTRSTARTIPLRTAGGTPEMSIKRIMREEGDTSQIVSVFCNDSAVPHSRYFYRHGFSEYISTRCLPDPEAAKDYIEVFPKTDFSIASGQGGFRLLGDFDRGPVTVRINPGAPTVDGGVVKSTYQQTLYMPGLQPKVEFNKSGRYLPKSAWRGLAVRHRNVDQVGVQVRRVPRANLVYWLSGEDERATSRTSDLVADARFPVRGGEDELVTTFVDLQDHVPAAEQGIYEITLLGGLAAEKQRQNHQSDTGMAEPEEEDPSYSVRWASRAVSRILLTDINLVVKSDERGPNDPWTPRHHVWALDMTTNAAMPGVEIKVVKASGKIMSQCVTGSDGGCAVDVSKDGIDPSGPIALVASKGSDFTYLKLSELRIDHSESQVHGEPYLSSKPYRGALYLDRGVYRPGDSAHVSAVIRQPGLKAPSAEMPVTLKLMDPRGKLVRKVNLTTNEAGMVSYDHDFADFAPTGSYNVTLEVAERVIGSKSFSVEEFVPERMKVEASGAATNYALGEAVAIDVEAKYLFGGSAAGSAVELMCSLKPAAFKPKNNANFHYGIQTLAYEKRSQAMSLGDAHGELDEEGQATIRCPAPNNAGTFIGGARVVAEVAVFEGGSGRTTRNSTSIPVHADTFYIGLDTGQQKVKAKESFDISGVVVDWDGNLKKDVKTINVEMYRLVTEWGWNWDASRNEERYTRFLRPVSEEKKEVSVSGGKFSVKLRADQEGEAFVIRATGGKSVQTDLKLPGHGRRYWWQPTETRVDLTPRPMKPTSMNIEVPKSIEVGANNEVIFEAPYQGRLLVTVETHEVLTSEWLDVKEPGPVKWNFSVNGVVPNVYVSGLLVKDPHLDSAEAFLPDRAFGVESVRVNPTAQSIDVKIDVPKEVASNGTLSVKLDVGPTKGPATVTVAAVDEGILSLTKFKTPDPMVDLFPRRKLGVGTEETVGWAIALPAAGNSSATGGGDDAPGGRVQAITPVALWSGVVDIPENGQVEIELEVPQYQGALRVMAVAADTERVGVAAKQVLVRDPLVLQTTLPRFLMAGDSVQVPVFVTNMSGKAQEITVDMDVSPMLVDGIGTDKKMPAPVEMTGARATTFQLEDGASKTVVFRAKAKARTGAATFRVQAKAGELVSKEELNVPFMPHGPRNRLVNVVPIEQGTTNLTDKLSGWVPTTEKTTVWVTSNPYGKAMGPLKYVIRYPYGCIEQTTSSTRPLLYVSNLLPAVLPEAAGKENVDDMVMHGVNRVLSMQTASGGFGYWPGASSPNSWGTAYATHMLLDAKDLQYEVPESALKEALDFLEQQVVTDRHRHYRNAKAYAHYVLARAGRGQKARILSEIKTLGDNPRGQYEEEAFMLKAALYLAGDRRFESELRNPAVTNIDLDKRVNNWSYYSELRKRGVQLSIVQDLFKPEVGGDAESLAQQVYEGLVSKSSSRHYTTQEIMWGITGLGKRVGTTAANLKANLKLNGKPATDRKSKGKHTWSVVRASEYSSVEVELPEAVSGKVYAIMTSDGIREDAVYREGGDGLAIQRSYVDSSGEALDVNQLTLGQVVYTVVTVTNQTGDAVQNIALVDRFPAGWEIENPRLGRGGVADFIDRDSLWQAEHLNLRDDRLELFGTLKAGESRSVVYALRAVTAGQYMAPPVEAEAMYDPSIWTRQLGEPVTVLGNWDDFFL